MAASPFHPWIVAPFSQDRQALWESLQTDISSSVVNCHRFLRGPYTGTGTLLRQLVPAVFQQSPELVRAHTVEILSIAPELNTLLAASHQTLTSLAVPKERTRFYAHTRTQRLAHGVIDFLKACLNHGLYSHLSLFFDNVHNAEPLDQEVLSALLRRADPARITVGIGTSSEPLPEPLATALVTYAHRSDAEPLSKGEYLKHLQSWQFPEIWQTWLLERTQGWQGIYNPFQAYSSLLRESVPQGETLAEGIEVLLKQAPEKRRMILAKAFVTSDGTSETLLERMAYQVTDVVVCQQWHDERADQLEQQHEWSFKLGAIPYHRERGTASADAGAAALREALDYCINMGYYEATIELGYRGRAVIDWGVQEQYYWAFTTKATTSLAALGRPEEAEKLYNEARALTSRPEIHMQAAYATAMLYTRHFGESRRDHMQAKGWINEAIGIASLFPDEKEQAFHTVFNQNGLALIEAHIGHFQEALRLVTEGLERLNQVLEPGEHLLHRSVLLYNRGQVYDRIGAVEEALIDYTAVIAQDPYYSEYYLDRGNLYRRLGRLEEALADYERAIEYSPPYPEVYYNRTVVRSLLGDNDKALADYNYVLELEPTYLDALINRASILYEQGKYVAARQDIEQGLRQDPHNPHLQCTLGLIEMAEGHSKEAYQAFSDALDNDSSLIEAWTNRAILSFEGSNIQDAIEDLISAASLEENATVYYNLGIAYQALECWQEAIDNFSHALHLSEEDAQDIFYRRGFCHLQRGNTIQAYHDFNAHLNLGPSPFKDELLKAGYKFEENYL